MAQRNAAQLELEMPEEPSVGAQQQAPAPRRVRAKAEGRPGWRPRFRRILIWTGVGVGVLALIAGGYQVDQFLASDVRFILKDPNFRVTGLQYASRDEVTRLFARDSGRSVYLVPLAERRRSLMAIDWVRDATVSRRWPNRLVVTVAERRPVAFLVLPRETALVDADGIILRAPERARFSLPVLAGITRQQSRDVRRERAGLLVTLMRQVPGYAGQISEVDVSDPDNVVVIEVVQSRAVRLLLGNRNYLQRMNNFMDHYSDIVRRAPGARTFDLRLDDRITAQNGGSDGR